MSILIVEPDDSLGPELVATLRAEGDEVRVLVGDRSQAERWKGLGAFVAVGDALDADLVERACTNVRTLVAAFPGKTRSASLLQALLPAASAAGTGRIVVCAPEAASEMLQVLNAHSLDYVVLVAGRRGFLPRKGPDMASLAAAVSAADDLAGEPRMVVDLTRPEGWAALKMPA